MSVLDEIKQLEKEIRETLRKSFSYGTWMGIFSAIAILELIDGFWTGIWTTSRYIIIIIFIAGSIFARLKQALYERRMFEQTLCHAHDETCTCGKKEE